MARVYGETDDEELFGVFVDWCRSNGLLVEQNFTWSERNDEFPPRFLWADVDTSDTRYDRLLCFLEQSPGKWGIELTYP